MSTDGSITRWIGLLQTGDEQAAQQLWERFPQLADRNELWQLLMTITGHNVCNRLRDQRQLKRGGGEGPTRPLLLADIVGDEPRPALAAQVAEEYRRLLGLLTSEELKAVAL